jgi:prevent-host-death family protein
VSYALCPRPSAQKTLDFKGGRAYGGFVTMTAEAGTGQLAELVKQVQAGNEVLVTQANKPVARLVAVSQNEKPKAAALRIRSFKGHRVLTPVISQADLAEEMFTRE